ncbi:MAG: type I-E CRISPR-associated endonuclease Cas1e [Candidatus Ornithospirochaeta sp.]
MKDRYPFIYLERGRLEIDDSSVKWIDSECNVVRLPIATISTILLGPGTSITHEAVKVLSSANTTVCWVGEDSLLFYATGISPTANTRNIRLQSQLASSQKTRLTVARRMFSYRFPDTDVSNSSLSDLMGKEGKRVKQLYLDKAEEYQVGWSGRSYVPGDFNLSDTTNKILTSSNSALYAIITSVVCATGYSPYIGFVHSGSPLPFIYDLADLYKEYLCIDFAFKMTKELAGIYDKKRIIDSFRERIIEFDLLGRIKNDIDKLFEGLK